MDSNLFLKKWGERLNQLLKRPVNKNPQSHIKQKDLAQALGVRESNITEWKKGNWDIRLTNIYAIVEYIKNVYPDSTPMLTLFSDLISDEIEMIKQPIIYSYETQIKELTEKYERDSGKADIEKYNKLAKAYIRLKNTYQKEYEAIHKVLLHLPKDMVDYFEKHLDISIWAKWGC